MASSSSLLQTLSQTARKAALLAGTAVAAGTALAGYGMYEAQKFTLRRETLAVLPVGASDIRILHLSDIHMVPGQQLKHRWLHSLADLAPDFVINTGDNLSHRHGIPALLDALKPLMAFPGAFVPGSNCYFAPQLKNPLRYLSATRTTPRNSPHNALPFEQMHQAFGAAGWVNMTNRNLSVPLKGIRLDLSGVDDAHLDRDSFAGWPAGSASALRSPHVKIALAHAPYQRVLDNFTRTGADIIFAGHTHGGQVCIPGYGALVSNCDLPTWRARGLTTWEVDEHRTALNVSAGIGHSRYVPIRIACPPEAVLVTLTAANA